MKELKIRTEAAGATGAPATTAAPAVPAAVGEFGPGNNWGQEPSRTEVTTRPRNYDGSRQPDAAAPLGYLDDGRPWSPYGCTAGGKVRRVPRPTAAARDPNRPAAPGDTPAHRLAPGEQKKVEDVKRLYAAYEDAKKRERELAKRIQEEHPGTEIAERVRDKPVVGAAVIEGLIKTVTAFLAKKLEDPDAKPSDKAIAEAAEKIRDASRYYGFDATDKSMATFAAVFAIVACFLPALASFADKLFGNNQKKTTEAAA